MNMHLALLRGINVSGKNIIKMEELKKTMISKGFFNVKTYIQSGNIFFETNIDEKDFLSIKLNEIIKESFGLDVPVIMVSKNELEFVVNKNPFLSKDETTKNLYVSFLSKEPKNGDLELLKAIDFNGDEFVLLGRFLFLKYSNSAAKTKLDNKMIEKKLNVTSTSRNWNTINNLLKIYDEANF